jgi:hypothetical protein
MGLLLVVAGVLVWLLAGLQLLGIILIILGVVLLFVPGVPYGYSTWHGRRAPP